MPTLISFPDAATFRRVIADRVVPEDVAEAPVLVDPENPLNLAVESPLSRPTSKLLGELEVSRVGRNRMPEWTEAESWYHVAPLDSHRHDNVGEAMLKLPAARAASWLPRFGGSITRLDIRLCGDSVLIRDPRCPRHQFERAADGEDGAKAFVEQAPGVWVEAGKKHPFPEKITCPDGQMVIVEQGGLQYLEKWGSEFREFATPLAEPGWKSSAPPADFRIRVGFKLASDAGADDAPAMWIVPTDELAEMAAELPPLALETLDVIDLGGTSLVRTNAKSPGGYWLPGHYPAWKLMRGVKNVYLPMGWKLAPAIRRSVLLEILGHRPDRVTWVEPGGNAFSVHSAADSFSPLSELVRHTAADEQPVDVIAISGAFPLERFTCREDSSLADKQRKPRITEVPIAAKVVPAPADIPTVRKPRPVRRAAVKLEVGEAEIARQELIRQFMAVEGPPDHPDRTALWPRLAEAHQGQQTKSSSFEADKCWVEAIWHGTASDEDIQAWAGSALGAFTDVAKAVGSGVSVAELKSTVDRLHAAESVLPVKGVWLAAKALHTSTGDVLGLARVRDRLLLRMHDRGVVMESDVPAFLRQKSSGGHGSTGGLMRLEEPAAKWVAECPSAAPYVGLIFAYGMARTGERKTPPPETAKLGPDTPVGLFSDFVTKAYRHRIDQAIRDVPPHGCLPADVLSLPGGPEHKPVKNSDAGKLQNAEYMINKFRGLSRVLEPQMRTDPFSVVLRKTGPDLRRELAAVVESENGREIEVFARKKLKACTGSDLHNCIEQLLPVSVRTTESLAEELVEAACRAMPVPFSDKVPDSNGVAVARQFGRIASRGIRAAGHFGLESAAQRLTARLLEAIQTARYKERIWLIAEGIGGSVREFRKLGRVRSLELLISKSEQLIGHDPETFPARAAIASARLVCGDLGGGRAILDQIREHLFANKTPNKLLCWTTANLYCSAVGHLPDTIDRYEEVLKRLQPGQIGELRGFESQYCPERHLVILETMVLSVAENNGVFGKVMQNWFDQEEFLVRQRIHADMAAARAAFGA